MNAVKYITFETGEFLIFPGHLNHDDMARCLGAKVESAGFVMLTDDHEIKTFGSSLTLNVGAERQDGVKIERYLRND